ncbi:MAG: thioredoxin family protein, partial [bacterium]|nr:thioredoxin family protein [bacterium]
MKNLLTILIISLVGVISIIVIGNTNHQYKQVINKLNNEKISKKITKNEIKNNSSIWLTNFKIAKAESKNRNLPIFILFTGSPWCSGCNKFNTNILNTHKFENFAKKHFILFKADYPFTPVGKKHEQTVAEINQNSYLKYKYDINEFPTVILLNRQEQIIKKLTGYPIVRGTKKYTDLLKKTLNYKSNKNKQINLNSKNTVKITSISPDLNKTLKVGQKVNFFIEV